MDHRARPVPSRPRGRRDRQGPPAAAPAHGPDRAKRGAELGEITPAWVRTPRGARQAEMNPAIENPGDRMASVTIGHCHGAGQGKGYRACVPTQDTRAWAAQCGDSYPNHEQTENSRYLPTKLRVASDGSQLRVFPPDAGRWQMGVHPRMGDEICVMVRT